MRHAKRPVAVAMGVLLLLAVGALVVLPRLDLAGFVAARATAALGRSVTIESLRVVPGGTVQFMLRGLRVGNVEGGTQPTMTTLTAADGALRLLPLLRGDVVLTRLRVDGLAVLLERLPDGRANWQFSAPAPAPVTSVPVTSAPVTSARVTPAPRRSPVVLDLRVADSEVAVRTTSGRILRTRITSGSVTAPAIDQPATLRAEGSYEAVALVLDGELGSIAALRAAATPFPMKLRASSGGTTLVFDGTATDPLKLDGLAGRLALRAPTPRTLLALAGADGNAVASVALDLAGVASRAGNLWQVTDAEGRLDGAPLTARLLRLTEGARGQPDAVALDLAFGELDLDRLLGGGGQSTEADPPLRVAARPDPLLELRLAAARLRFRAVSATQVALQATVAPGRIAIGQLAGTVFDASITASGALEQAQQGARVTGQLQLRDGEVDALRRALGLPALPLSGQVEAHAVLESEGTTVNQAARDARVSAVLSVRQGSVAREVIEMASTDIRALFRTARGTTPLTCLLAVIDIRAGRGEAAPLRLRAGTGTISGLAQFDLSRRNLDVLIGSQRATTNFWALDLPVRVSGGFADPDIAVGEWPPEAEARLTADDNLARLAPDLRGFARANPCYQGSRR